MSEHDKSPAPTPSPLADPQHTEAKQHGPSPVIGPTQVDKLANRWNLTTGHTIDLGDVEVDREQTVRTSIFALDVEQGPRFQARVTGEPAIRYSAGPNFVPGTRSTYDSAKDLLFEVRPTKDGRLKGTLELEVLDNPREIHRVPVIAAAHQPGDATLDNQDREARERAKRETDEADAAKRHEQQRKGISKDRERDYPVHGGAQDDLQQAKDLSKTRLEVLQQARRDGIQMASDEIGSFVRAKPMSDGNGPLFELAMMALSVATAGIAAAVARRLLPMVVRELATYHGPAQRPFGGKPQGPVQQLAPSDVLIAFVTDGIKQSVKDAAKLVTPSKRGDPTVQGGSADRKAMFLARQREALRDSDEVSTQTTNHIAAALRPMLRDKPGATKQSPSAVAAISVMHRVGEAAIAEVRTAEALQAHQTVTHWVRHLAHQSVGVGPGKKQGDGGPLMSVGRASDKHFADQRLDGLVDIRFTAVQANPQAPIKVTAARLLGVKEAVVTRFLASRLLDTKLPVRAICELAPQQSLVIARDEAGNIDYSDDTSGNVHAGSWFARRAGVRANARPTDQLRGARDLIENDIMKYSLGQLVEKVEEDSDE